MRRIVAGTALFVILAGCTGQDVTPAPAVAVAAPAGVVGATVSAPRSPAPRPKPASVAHAIALLAAGRDDLVVETYLWQLKRQTGCSPGAWLAFAGKGVKSRLALNRAQSRATAELLQEYDYSYVGGAIARVSVPYRTVLASGKVGDAAWAAAVVALRCPHVPR